MLKFNIIFFTSQLREFHEQCLKQHNMYREKHHVPPLKLDASLNQLAQDWADVND